MNWILSANSNKYDHEGAFKKFGFIDWRQNVNYEIGDFVYIYCTIPIKRIRFKCIVTNTNMTQKEKQDDEEFWLDRNNYLNNKKEYIKYVRLKLIDFVDTEELSLELLQKHGLKAAPQDLPQKLQSKPKLEKYIEGFFKENDNDTSRLLKVSEKYTRQEIHDIFSPDTQFTPGAGYWGISGIIKVPDTEKDYIFLVTYGQKQAHHQFDEEIDENGVLTWQSQPKQKLDTPQIIDFINHNYLTDNIYLFLREDKKDPYTYMGKLAYVSHDNQKEMPVYFKWQILDWDENTNNPALVKTETVISRTVYSYTINRESNKCSKEKKWSFN